MRELPPLVCGGCTKCCRRELVQVMPEDEHRMPHYEGKTEILRDPVSGKQVLAIRLVDGGDCVFLDRSTGCTIYEHRPAVCRTFDCRRAYERLMALPRNVRRRMGDRDVVDEGRKRLKEAGG